jgi:hypothetical protein
LLLASCQSMTGSKSSNSGTASENDTSKTIISTYSGGQVSLRGGCRKPNPKIPLKSPNFSELFSCY